MIEFKSPKEKDRYERALIARGRREELARAAATDEGNRRMRKSRREKWNLGDYLAAVRKFNQLTRVR